MSVNIHFLPAELQGYLRQVSVRESATAHALRQATQQLSAGNMQIAPEQGQFMQLLIQILGARHILEIGTFTGYSALVMAEALPPGGELITIDKDPQWQHMANQHWEQAGVAHKIKLLVGDAVALCDELLTKPEQHGYYDFIFIDADKKAYPTYYEKALQLVRVGGVIAIDNTLWDGKVVQPSERADGQTRAIQALNQFIHDDTRVDMSLVPIGDGLTLVRKNR